MATMDMTDNAGTSVDVANAANADAANVVVECVMVGVYKAVVVK
jgi:hypothetical protein